MSKHKHTPKKSGGGTQNDRSRSSRPDSNKQAPDHKNPKGRSANTGSWIYGIHAAFAAIENPERNCQRIMLTEGTAKALAKYRTDADNHEPLTPHPKICHREDIDTLLPEGAVHQGVAVLSDPLKEMKVEDLCRELEYTDKATILILDQATDPRNIGSVLRSAAAFGAAAVIVQDRHAPETTGVLAKAASGALELVPLIRETNLSRAIKLLKEAGFWSVGLAGDTDQELSDIDLGGKTVLILGSEGSGLRRLVRENCDHIAKIPIEPNIESLNLSNAAAIALYEVVRSKK